MSRSYITVFLSVLATLWSCQPKGNSIDLASIKIPDVQLESTNPALQRVNGKWLHNNQPFSGRLLVKYPGGQTKSITTYYQGGEHGVSNGWYPDGKRWFERPYILGKKNGVHKTWWHNGRLKHQADIKEDKYEGNVKSWYQDGRPYKDFNYKNGQEAGHQRAWKSDGRIKVNYVIENGRRYGLTGVKNCRNASEKIRKN